MKSSDGKLCCRKRRHLNEMKFEERKQLERCEVLKEKEFGKKQSLKIGKV